MKRKIISIMLAAAMLMSFALNASAFEQWSYSEDLTVCVNGMVVDNGQYKPIIVNDRTMVRFVPVIEALGFTAGDGSAEAAYYSYSPETKSISFTKNGSNATFTFVAESANAIVGTGGGDLYPLEVPATLQYFDVFYIPIRAFCDMTGLSITWDAGARTVYINGDINNTSTIGASNTIAAGSYRAYTNDAAREGIANLDITAADGSSITFSYTRRNGHEYDLGNVTANIQEDGTYEVSGEDRTYKFTAIDANTIGFKIIIGDETVESLTFEKL